MKVEALNKAMYLRLFDCDTHWLPFRVVEIMSLPKYSFKKSGYKAAAECLDENEEALLMATNQLKKDMNSQMKEVRHLVLELLVVLPVGMLLQEFAADVIRSVQSGNDVYRNQFAPILWKICRMDEEYWDVVSEVVIHALQNKEHLTAGVMGLLPELSMLYPRRMLGLVPHMYNLFVDAATPPWAKIKLLKAFQSLSAHEARLSKKIGPTLRTLVRDSTPMPLLYETITTVICMLPNDESLVAQCCNCIPLFFSRGDGNLTYLGLQIVSDLIQAQGAWIAQDFEQYIVECVKTEDSAMRRRALKIVSTLTSTSSLKRQTEVLLGYLRQASLSPGVEDAVFCADLVNTILTYCMWDNYGNVEDDVWYIDLLAKLAKFPMGNVAEKLVCSIYDFCTKRPSIHAHAVKSIRPMLDSLTLLESQTDGSQTVLSMVSWVVGEYCTQLDDFASAVLSMLKPLTLPLREEVRLGFTSSIIKILVAWQKRGVLAQETEHVCAIREQLPSLDQVYGLVELEQRLKEVKNIVDSMCMELSSEPRAGVCMLNSLAAIDAQPLQQPNAATQKQRALSITARFNLPSEGAALLGKKYGAETPSASLKDLKTPISAPSETDSDTHTSTRDTIQEARTDNNQKGIPAGDTLHRVHLQKRSIYYLGGDKDIDQSLHGDFLPRCGIEKATSEDGGPKPGSIEHSEVAGRTEKDPSFAEEPDPNIQARSSRRKPSREAFIKDA